MGLGTKEDRQSILDEIKELRREVVALRGEREGAEQAVTLTEQVNKLRRELTDLEITKDRATERHEREKREVKHMVGLERERQTFETEQAKREATVTVREEALKADRDRFAEQIEFHEKRFSEEVGYLQKLMGKVLERLPTVTVDRKITEGEADDGD